MPLNIESPGITDTVFVTVSEADLPDHVRVMGVEVEGQFRTTWGEWKKAHPDSLLFEGNGWDV
tara:strand:- start:83 stop:271 length:189 start_codon:yes stop_codon:yes gene_type:complete